MRTAPSYRRQLPLADRDSGCRTRTWSSEVLSQVTGLDRDGNVIREDLVEWTLTKTEEVCE